MKRVLLTALSLMCYCLTFAQWQNIKNFPEPVQDGAFAVTVGNKAYIGGGLAGNAFYSYDATTNSYSRLTDVPSPGTNLGWAVPFVIGQKIYICGGAYNTAGDPTDDFWEYDIITDKWSQKKSFAGGKTDGGFAFSLNGKGYVGGGFNGNLVVDDMYQYDPVTDTWVKKAKYPGGVVLFPSYFVIDNIAYVGLGAGPDEKANFYSYNDVTDKWTQKKSFPGTLRQAGFSFSHQSKGYVGGGQAGYNTTFNDFWEYDSPTDEWNAMDIDATPENNNAWGMSFVLGDKFYIGLGVHMPSFNYNSKIYSHAFPTATGLEGLRSESGLRIYPNPSKGEFRVEFEGQLNDIDEIVLIDLSGREIDFKYLEKEGFLYIKSVDELSLGQYQLIIKTTKDVLTQKVLIAN